MAAPYASNALTAAIALANIRTDLNDLDNTNYRWVDATVTREIDRALDRYSYVAPFLQLKQIPTIPHSKLYPSPAGSWWLDRVEYPLNRYPRLYQPFKERLSPLIADPTATTGALALARLAAGALNGTYQYAYTFLDPSAGETKPAPIASITVAASSQVQVSAIPFGPYGVTARNLYRTAAGGSQLKLLTTLTDNQTASSYTDNTADGSLGANAPTTNTTQGNQQFELQLSPYTLPQDNTGWLEVTYAGKHLLDSTGTTIPEEHWDALYLGAQSYLVQQWLGNVNDNFDYVDGQFRDRVDDTRSMQQWLATYESLTAKFEHRLREIKQQTNDSITLVGRWGDKPYRWDRL